MKVPIYVITSFLLLVFLFSNMVLKSDYFNFYRNIIMLLQIFIIAIGIINANFDFDKPKQKAKINDFI
jgi:hypothetical protein